MIVESYDLSFACLKEYQMVEKMEFQKVPKKEYQMVDMMEWKNRNNRR